MRYSPITFASARNLFGDDWDRARFYADNCETLANFLESKPDEAHNQSVWTRPDDEAPCGTVGCALGWAAMSQIIDGLQYALMSSACATDDIFARRQFVPTINGREAGWDEAGRAFFGQRVLNQVFLSTTLDKQQTIDTLRAEARRLHDNGL